MALEASRREFLQAAAALSAGSVVLSWSTISHGDDPGPAVDGLMDGYLGAPSERVDEAFGGGFSMYVAAWPLLGEYPGSRFQTGLFGTWMHARVDNPEQEGKLYSDIEGGLGWWRDTRFATVTPKFIMGGVALNFSEWANGPGAGKGRNWAEPAGKYGVAQLSSWVIWPPDGLNLQQGTCGELFGYGYLPLPLTEPKSQTSGVDLPTGNQCWTLFLNTANFKGPVAFFTPYFFSNVTIERPELAGMFLDNRPSNPNRALQMETQYVPAIHATGKQGKRFARVTPTRFPIGADGNSTLVHRVMSYRKEALWESVQGWFDGGPEASGRIDDLQAIVHRFTGDGWSTWRISTPDERMQLDWPGFATPFASDPHTFGFRWDETLQRSGDGDNSLVTLPEYYVLEGEGESARWVPISDADVDIPESLRRPIAPGTVDDSSAYVTPDDGCWTQPGPVAGPFEAQLGDGSIATYSWYRFADQPALLNADLTEVEREQLQERVEKLHRTWAKDREYLPPPQSGSLASLDPAVIVEPPTGLEAGYVPIVTRQEKRL